MDISNKDTSLESLLESCKPAKKRGRPSHKRQLHEIRHDHKINLQTPDSVVTVINLKSILTLDALKTLPAQCRVQLTRLLPDFDQITTQSDATPRPSDTALSNEYFARFCTQYQEKLSENKLSEEAVEQSKSDTSKELAKMDPWKLKNFEPMWGRKLVSQILDQSGQEPVTERGQPAPNKPVSQPVNVKRGRGRPRKDRSNGDVKAKYTRRSNK